MGRVSKRKAAGRKIQAGKKRVYKAGIYVRLSSEKNRKPYILHKTLKAFTPEVCACLS